MELKQSDRKILWIIQKDGKRTIKDISKETGIKQSTVHDRIKRMERAGIIKRYAAVLDEKKLGLNVFYLFVKLKPSKFLIRSQKDIVENKNISEISILGGEFDILFKCYFGSVVEFGKFVERFRDKYAEHVQETLSVTCFGMEKDTTEKPV